MITKEGTICSLALAEERFVLSDRFALVVKDCPAAADPTRIDVRAAFHQWSRLCLNLFLDLPSKAIGVGEADLNLRLLGSLQVADMCFARERDCERRLAIILETIQIVDDAGSSFIQ